MTAASEEVQELRLVLPDDWAVIPLHPGAEDSTAPSVMTHALDRLVERQFRGVDNQPQLKRETRRELEAAARTAARAGGRLMAISLMSLGEVPLSAQLTTYLLDLGAPRGENHLDDLVECVLATGMNGNGPVSGQPEPARQQPLAQPDHQRSRLPAGDCVRRVRELESTDDNPVPVLVADYWFERPDGLGLAQLTCSTGMIAWREPILGLFDALASTAHWRARPQS